jgi:multisubunit Na+/H+ antiporter MnhF subunit
VTKRRATLQDQLLGIGCLILVIVTILLCLVVLYNLGGPDLFGIGLAVVIALVGGLSSLIAGKQTNN